jgi:hypothetical protein
MSMTVTESAIVDLEKQREAMAKRAMSLGSADPAGAEEIPAWVLRSIGTAVRFEVDVTQPIADLKREINTIRAELGNCLVTLEQNTSLVTRRQMVHSRLTGLRAHLRFEREERKMREKRQPNQPD